MKTGWFKCNLEDKKKGRLTLSGTSALIIEELWIEEREFGFLIRRTDKGFYVTLLANSASTKNKLYKRLAVFLGEEVWREITGDYSFIFTYKVEPRYYNHISLFYLGLSVKDIYKILLREAKNAQHLLNGRTISLRQVCSS